MCQLTFLTNLAVSATELAKFAMAPESKRRKLIGEAQEAAGLQESSRAESVNTLQLNVSLPSGRCASLSLPVDGTVLDLKLAAQKSLGQGFLRLAAPDGRLLNPTEPLQDSRLKAGDCITAVAQKPKVAATNGAMALWCPGGGVVTLGRSDSGGDSTRVRDQLKNVQQIHATWSAFAAILADGCIVTWGSPASGRRRYHGQGSAQECPADSCHRLRFCCNSSRWQRCDVGRSRLWWRQHRGQGSAQDCSGRFMPHGTLLLQF